MAQRKRPSRVRPKSPARVRKKKRERRQRGRQHHELLGLGLLALRPPRVRGPALAQAGQLAALAVGVAFVVRLPFALAIVWWQRHEGIARVGYGRWLLDRLPELAVRAAILAAAAAVIVVLAGRLGRRWWLVGVPAFVAIVTT